MTRVMDKLGILILGFMLRRQLVIDLGIDDDRRK